MRLIPVALCAALALFAAPAASAATLLRGASSPPSAIAPRTEAGVSVWRGPRAVDLDDLLAGGAPRAEPPRAIIEIYARPPRQVSRQGFYSGDPAFSRRYTQGFYSGAPVRRASTLIVIDRR